MRLFIGLFSLLILAGCKTELVASVKLSDLGSNKITEAIGESELSSCTEVKVVDGKFVDTGRQSNSLIEFRQKLSFIFPFAKFEGCEKKNFRSVASFSVPFKLENGPENKSAKIPSIRIEGKTVYVDIPRQSGADLDRELTKQFSSIGYSDVSLVISLSNDSTEKLSGDFFSLHIEGLPIVASELTVKANTTVRIKLSSVALEAIAKGDAPFFMRLD